jgi:hypothetical protein
MSITGPLRQFAEHADPPISLSERPLGDGVRMLELAKDPDLEVDVMVDASDRQAKILIGPFVFEDVRSDVAVDLVRSFLTGNANLRLKKFPWPRLVLSIPLTKGVEKAVAWTRRDLANLTVWERILLSKSQQT